MGAIESAGIGALGAKKDREAEARANKDLTRRMEASRQEYLAQRPANSLARQHAAQNLVGLYEPANAMLGEMMGRGPGNGPMNLQQVTQRWPDMMSALQQTQQGPAPRAPGMPIDRPPQGGAPGWGGVGRQASPAELGFVPAGTRKVGR